MKIILPLICLSLVSCSTPEKTARLGQLVDLAITVAQSRNFITAQDAQDIRDAKTIVLPTEATPAPSGK